MSNNVAIQTTEFKNVPSGEVTKGFRIYDDYGCYYDNNWESIPEDDIEILEMVIDTHDPRCRGVDDPIRDMLKFIKEEEKGVNINGEWYDWDTIKELFP